MTLGYSSSGGNSEIGAGWALNVLQTVSIYTRRHLPRWDGTDRFQLGSDELVPELDASGQPRGHVDATWSVAFYRPRRSGQLVRVEKWVECATGRVHFRTRDARNSLTIYGARPAAAARISDPADESRTLVWLPELQIDPRGNAVWLDYVAETSDGVDRTAPFEPTQDGFAQRYLKRVRYGNVTPLALGDALLAGTMPDSHQWCFQVVVDYGDHADADHPTATPDRAWPARVDAFTTCRPGFAVRTHRLCRRILAFHDFPELGASPTLVGALAITHDEQPVGSTVTQLQYRGYRSDGTNRTLPALVMTYAPAATETAFTAAPSSAQQNVPAGFAGSNAFVDLFGDGLPGILSQRDRAWYYKPNLGGGEFGAQVAVLERPATRVGEFVLGDRDGDGDPDFVALGGRVAGRYVFDREWETWSGFEPFSNIAHVEALGGRVQTIDLNGDGLPDLVIARQDALVWYASTPNGFAPPVEVPRPDALFGTPTISSSMQLDLFFADMNGDGLVDLVRVQNGCVMYWPSLGNGVFGDTIVMDGAPQFAADDDFDPSRLRFVDIDGSGTSDIVYLGAGQITYFINASGNSLALGVQLDGLPYIEPSADIEICDFLGDGRACLVWSSPLAGRDSAIEYLALSPALKPRLLLSVDNSTGQEIQLGYSTSCEHYLRDLASGRGWSARLPQNMTVADRREVIDHISGSRSVSRFEYHDGYYDGVEREFRTFGQVDIYDADSADGSDPGTGGAAFAPPSLTRTWFHLGCAMVGPLAPLGRFVDPALLPLQSEQVEAAGALDPEDLDDGLRALAGSQLRREMWSVDATGALGAAPFVVEQASYRLRLAQPPIANAPSAWLFTALESLTATYEQAAADPRLMHAIVVAADAYCTPVRTADLAYARRAGKTLDVAAQGENLVTVSDARVVHFDDDDRYELAVPVESRRYHVTGLAIDASGRVLPARFTAVDVTSALAQPLSFEVVPPADALGPRARQLAWTQLLYWDDARSTALPLATIGALTLLHHVESACLTTPLVGDALSNAVDVAQLASLGYTQHDSYWWSAEPVRGYATAAQFSVVTSLTRGDGATTSTTFDPYALVPVATTDALGNQVHCEIDYHLIAPWRSTNTNGGVDEARFDPLGVAIATAAYGQVQGQSWGSDPVAAWTASPNDSIATVLADPAGHLQTASTATYYDLDAWSRDGSPMVVLALAREGLVHDGAGGTQTGATRVAVQYLDGLRRPLQSKALVEAGPAIQRDAAGNVVVDASGLPVLAQATTRWSVSGHVTYDAKQQPALAYEPFFSTTSAYEGDAVLQQFGVSTLSLFDATRRTVSRQFANGTYASTVYRAWSQDDADANDNVLGTTYLALRQGLSADDPELQALNQAKGHAGTVATTFFDPRGHACASLKRGGTTAEDQRTVAALDIDGAPTSIVDPRGVTSASYRRDMRGNGLVVTSADAGSSRQLVDAFGRAVLAWSPRGFAITRTFDLLDRPLATKVTGGDGPTPLNHRVEEWQYGESLADPNQARAANQLGRVVVVHDGAGSTTIDRYDPIGAELGRTQQLRSAPSGPPDWSQAVALDSEQLTWTSTCDAVGRTIASTAPDGTKQTFMYLASGGLSRVGVTTPDGSLADTPIMNGITVNSRGQLESTVLGNGVQTTYGYDPRTYRLATQLAMSGTRTLQSFAYTYDPVGNIVRTVDSAQIVGSIAVAGRRDFSSDAHYRLRKDTGRVHQALLQNDFVVPGVGTLKATRHIDLNNGQAVEAYTRSYSYDATGNLTAIQHVGSSQSWTTNLWISPTSNRSLPAVDLNNNPITNPETQFDAGGNAIALSHLRSMAWGWQDVLERAVVISRPGGTDDDEVYAYGAGRQRAIKLATRVVTGNVVETTEKAYFGNVERKRIRAGGTLVLERWTLRVPGCAEVYRWTKDDQERETDSINRSRVRYQLTTHQGSVALALDEQANIISYEEFFSHGGSAFIAGDDVREMSIKDYRFCAKECDDATSLYYFGLRYYAPWIGRWLSPDPKGPIDGFNLYQYVLGDPIGRVDPDGGDSRSISVSSKTEDEALAAWNSTLPASATVAAKHATFDKKAGQWRVTEYTPIAPDVVAARMRKDASDFGDAMKAALGNANTPGDGSNDATPPPSPPPAAPVTLGGHVANQGDKVDAPATPPPPPTPPPAQPGSGDGAVPGVIPGNSESKPGQQGQDAAGSPSASSDPSAPPTGDSGAAHAKMTLQQEIAFRQFQRGGLTPDQIGDVYKTCPPLDYAGPTTDEAAERMRNDIDHGEAKRRAAKEAWDKNPPLTRDEQWQIAKDSARNFGLDHVKMAAGMAMPGTKLFSDKLIDMAKAPEPPANPTNFREWQMRENYDFMTGTLTTAELATAFVPVGEIAASGRLAISKLPVSEAMIPELAGSSFNMGLGRMVSSDEQFARLAARETAELTPVSQIRDLPGIVKEPNAQFAQMAVKEGEALGLRVETAIPSDAEMLASKRYLEVYQETRDPGLAGKAFHDELGAAPNGPDFGGTSSPIVELKTRNPFQTVYGTDMKAAMDQAMGYWQELGYGPPPVVRYFEMGSGNVYIISTGVR